MRLHTSIARYIRRCGYAMALTVAAISFISETHAATYDFDTHLPSYPSDTPVYDTQAILDAVGSSYGETNAQIRIWTPFRPDKHYDYETFIPDVTSTQASDNVVRIHDARRPLIQENLPTLVTNHKVETLSYIAGRSLAPCKEDYEYWQSINYGCGDTVTLTDPKRLGFEKIPYTERPIDANNNKLIISNAGFALAIGGYSQYGNANNNLVYIRDVRVSDDIYGGCSYYGNSNENTVIVIRADCIGANYTGESTGDAYHAAYNNGGQIIGGISNPGELRDHICDAHRNKVFVYGSYTYQQVMGAYASGDANNNEVLISRSEIAERDSNPAGGGVSNRSGKSNNNIITVDDTYDGYIPPEEGRDETWDADVAPVSVIHTSIAGGATARGGNNSESSGNVTRIIGTTREGKTTTIEGNVYGGWVDNYKIGANQSIGNANNNLVEISGAHITNARNADEGKVYGGSVSSPSGTGNPGNANHNIVSITDTIIENSVYGGWNDATERVESTDAEGKPTYLGDASHNTQIFENVITNGKALTFYGGWSKGGNTNYNNVYLRNSGWSMSNTYLHGGWGNTGHELDTEEDYLTNTKENWLHIEGFQGEIKGFDHFEGLHFVVTGDVDPEKPMLTLTGDQSNPDEATSMKINGDAPITVTVDLTDVADELKPGSIIPLIGHKDQDKEIAGMETVDDKVRQQSARRGVTRRVTYEMEFTAIDDEASPYDNMGGIRIKEVTHEVTPESKALMEGRIATLTLNNMGGNLVAEQGIDSACRALEGGSPEAAHTYLPVARDAKGSPIYAPKSELDPGNRLFFAMSGEHNKVDSGSDVDVDGVNALVGISRGFMAKRALTLGAFMETGWGKYHTHNNFGAGADVPTVRGTGETSYVGAGALLRYHLEHLNKKLDGVSLDASVRLGRQETDYSTADLVDDYGTFARYEHESDYIAGHVGVNYTFQPTDKLSALLYARYLWTHVSNEEATVCGETVSFEDMHSNRVRLGGRLSWKATEKWMPYAGAAYEWEFSGTARANTHGMGITAPSMHGGSVIGEIGTVWQPSLNRALWIEGALQGSVGKNENIGARLGVSIGF